jgi:hypothetical protein
MCRRAAVLLQVRQLDRPVAVASPARGSVARATSRLASDAKASGCELIEAAGAALPLGHGGGFRRGLTLQSGLASRARAGPGTPRLRVRSRNSVAQASVDCGSVAVASGDPNSVACASASFERGCHRALHPCVENLADFGPAGTPPIRPCLWLSTLVAILLSITIRHPA